MTEILALGIATCLLLALLWAWHTTDDNFNLRHILVDSKTDRISLRKVGQMIALLTSTWVIVNETTHARLTEWLFFGYGAMWVSANLGSKWIDKKDAAK